MAELTKEQKEDLNSWYKKQKIFFIIYIILFFIITPAIIYIFNIDAHYLFGVEWAVSPITAGALTTILVFILIDIRYGKKCPNCGHKITGKNTFGYKIMTFSLPEKCNNCGVKFK